MKRSGPLVRRSKRRSPEEKAASGEWADTYIDAEPIMSEHEWGLPVLDRHHLILRRVCRERGAPEWDVRNQAIVSRVRHFRHHAGLEPIRFAELSPERQEALREFAAEHGLTEWVRRHLEGFEP